jgi:hypothetical protein
MPHVEATFIAFFQHSSQSSALNVMRIVFDFITIQNDTRNDDE